MLLKAVGGDTMAAYSALVAATRRILGSPSFHPIAKLVWESLMDKELKKAIYVRRRRATDSTFPHRSAKLVLPDQTQKL
jgi:hypothetical protein